MPESFKVYAIGAEFRSVVDLLCAAEKIRELGYRHWDVFSPFPIHGMDRAMGLGKSWLSAGVFCGGLTGLTLGALLTTIPSFKIYPMIVHGKPYNWATAPAFFPICFELTVLLSAFAAIGCLLLLTQLPRLHHPVFNWDRFKRVTDDGFFVVIEARDKKFAESSTRSFLESIGGRNITLIHD